jgi:hypothetical protein
MADEISIYISPEDDITTVRERLEKTTSRQVTLVIPADTQLRSLVAWRVLHSDARRMGKDVLVVSTDPQIRSLAQAGKFRVAHSQAASISGKSRPPTRPGRTNAPKGRLTSSQARMQAAKKPSVQLPPNSEDENEVENTPARKKEPTSSSFGSSPASSTFYTTEQPFESSTTGSFRENNAFSTSLDAPQSGQIVDLHPENRISPFRPNRNIQEDDANNQWADSIDFQQAEDIRNSAQYSDSPATPPVQPVVPPTPRYNEQQAFESAQGAQYRTTPLPSESENVEEVSPDYYSLMEDKIPRSPLSEQRGSAYANGFDQEDESSVSERNVEPRDTSDDEFQVDDLGEDAGGDVKMFDLPNISQDAPHHVWSEPLEQEQPESSGPSRIYRNNAPRTSRRENRENVPPLQPTPKIDEPDALPPIEDRPTVVIPPEELPAQAPRRNTGNTGRPAASARNFIDLPETPPAPKQPGAKRASQQMLGNSPRGTVARPQTQAPQHTSTNAGQRRAAPRVAPPTRKLPAQSSRRSTVIIASSIILLVLLVGIVAFALPTADVTLRLPAKDYSHAVTLKAVTAGQQGNALDTVPADSLNNTFEATGTGRATSSAKVGTAPATGEVTFTNASNVLVTIPSGTIVTTNSGTAFATQAEAVVNTANSNVGPTIQVPIKAQTAGTSGNVPAGSINAIPPDSLNAIVTYNKMNSSDLKLTVTNEQPTASGGVGNTPAVSQKDIDATKASLDGTLQSQFKTWLAQKTASGDESGILTSTETLENAPSVGQTTADGTFTAKLRLSVTVLIVRAATLQRASIAQLDRYILADKNKAYVGYSVVDDAKLPVQVQNLKTSSDNKSTLTLNYTAAAKVVQSLDIQHLRGLILGKSVADARKTLQSIPGVQRVDISTGPMIGNGLTPGWISYLSSNITIHLIPEDTTTPPKKK